METTLRIIGPLILAGICFAFIAGIAREFYIERQFRKKGVITQAIISRQWIEKTKSINYYIDNTYNVDGVDYTAHGRFVSKDTYSKVALQANQGGQSKNGLILRTILRSFEFRSLKHLLSLQS